MGVKGLVPWLRKTIPNVIHQVPLKSFSGQRVAVDASVYLYKFVCIGNQFKGNWFDMFLNLVLWLRKNNIRPVFVFDGKPPPEKERTQKERRAGKAKLENKLLELEELLELVEEVGINQDLEPELKQRIDDILQQDTTRMSRKAVLFQLNYKYKKYNSQCIHIRDEDVRKVQDLLTYLGLPWFKAPGEAEKHCAWLCSYEYVKAVVTTDSDVLAYGCPLFLQDVRVNQEFCKLIRYEDVLEALALTKEQFTDLCIMCGTDYNENMPKIGPKKAYDLLCDYTDLDQLSQTTYDTSVLYYPDGRRLFTLPGPDADFQMPRVKPMQISELELLLFKSNSRFTVPEIQQWLYRPQFTIVD